MKSAIKLRWTILMLVPTVVAMCRWYHPQNVGHQWSSLTHTVQHVTTF